MKVNSNRKDKRRGFTVVELVVALAIIVIVSATAIGLINSQNTVYLRTMQTVEATNMAENAIECFRFAKGNVGEFEATYEKSLNETITLNDDTDNGITDYTFEKSDMKVIITINGNTLEFNATDISSGKVILDKSYTYTK